MKIVFTGGSYSGKYDLLLNMKNKYNIKNEVISTNIELLIYLLGMEGYKKWRNDNFIRFQEMNIFKNLERDIFLSEGKNHFLDRGVFDFFASLKRENLDIPDELLKLTEKIHYDLIFFLEEIPFLDKTQEGRLLDKKQSKLWGKFIKEEYINKFGEKKIIFVPHFGLNNIEDINIKRLEFIEKELRMIGIIN